MCYKMEENNFLLTWTCVPYYGYLLDITFLHLKFTISRACNYDMRFEYGPKVGRILYMSCCYDPFILQKMGLQSVVCAKGPYSNYMKGV
jgi:hypothetical protein